MGRTYRADAIVLRSIRFGEADRVLHIYTAERGRVNAIAKGVRKTTSRFGGRLEPLTRAALMLHEGRGELHTVSGADITSAHAAVRARPYTLGVALIGAEAVLKLHPEPDPQPRVFDGLGPLIGYSPVAGGAVCERCSGGPEWFRLRPRSLETIEQLIERPLRPGPLDAPAAQDAVRVVEATYAFHGGFRMRTLHA